MTFEDWIAQYPAADLARELGVSRSRVSAWRQGKAWPSRDLWPELHRLSGGQYFMSAEELRQLRGIGKG